MKNILKTIIGSMLGSLIALGTIFMFFFIMIAGSVASSQKGNKEGKKKEITENSVLEINLNKKIIERKEKKISFNDVISGKNIYLLDLKKSITIAKENKNIKGINLIFDEKSYISTSISYNLYKILKDFKTSGKFINSYGNNYLQMQYLLASSVSDSIFMNPNGSLDFRGLSSEISFYKKFQEKYGIKFDIIRHGKYKSAVEPYIRENLSKENKHQISTLLNSTWDYFLDKTSKKRKISKEKLNNMADYHLGNLAQDALKYKLVDALCYETYFRERNKKSIKYTDILGHYKKEDIVTDKIAVLYLNGEISYNDKSSGGIDNIPIVKEIKKINEKKNIKALVLRVNSPGGSSLSSDIIWNELKKIKKKIPIVVSMGNYAASGGYYISSASNYIFAEPNTITGSIGVFGMIPNLEKFSNEHGIKTQVVQTNKNSANISLLKGISKEQEKIMVKTVENVYNTFINVVSENRGMNFKDVDKLAQGRVWIGSQAKNIGLVDEIGSLDNAISKASELSGIKKYNVVTYPKEKEQIEKIMEMLKESNISIKGIYSKILNIPLYDIDKINKRLNVQAKVPFILDIK